MNYSNSKPKRWNVSQSKHSTEGIVIERQKQISDIESCEKNHHDFRGAFQSLEHILFAIKTGYRFDDEMAVIYVTRLEAAIATLRPDFHGMDLIYKALRDKFAVIQKDIEIKERQFP